MNKEQAEEITDIASYKEVTGAKRFKRTKDEMARGLSVEEALEERLAATTDGKKKKKKKTHSGDIHIHIRPPKGVNSEYLEQLTKKPIEITLDDAWYGWIDDKLTCPYDGDIKKLLTHIFDLGIGEVITRYHFPDDLKNE